MEKSKRTCTKAAPRPLSPPRCAGRRPLLREPGGVASPRRHSGGECERGACPPFTIGQRKIGTRRSAPQAREGVSIPEPGAVGSRVPRPQPLPLRGLRAARAALAALRHEVPGGPGRGPPSSSSWRHRATSRQRPPPGSAWCAVRSTAVPVWRPAFQAVCALLDGERRKNAGPAPAGSRIPGGAVPRAKRSAGRPARDPAVRSRRIGPGRR